MAEERAKAISLKALVGREKNRVIMAESDEDFVDVLFSFLTMPMGTIIRRTRNTPPAVGIGCLNNLYESVEKLDVRRFHTELCKTLLLYPRNAAEADCKKLRLNIDDGESLKYFVCRSRYCRLSGHKLLSYYQNTICDCGENMDFELCLSKIDLERRPYGDTMEPKRIVFDAGDGGVFVKDLTRVIISNELEVMPASTRASFSLLSEMDGSTFEEWNLNIGVDEVLVLLKYSLVSKTALTETLLKHNPILDILVNNESAPEVGKEDSGRGNDVYVESTMGEPALNVYGGIPVKLMVSKSKNKVCYAEASEDFVDLLFSFLGVPLGYIVKEMCGTSKGCISHLYSSVSELDAMKCLKSSKHSAKLLSPKLAPDLSYENHPLGIEEHKHPTFYYAVSDYGNDQVLTSDKSITSCGGWSVSTLTVMERKSRFTEATDGGFMRGPAKFTVTDNLIITPISPVSCLSLLNKLEVPLSDIKECAVHVGCHEALNLLLASFESESALTNAFLREPNP